VISARERAGNGPALRKQQRCLLHRKVIAKSGKNTISSAGFEEYSFTYPSQGRRLDLAPHSPTLGWGAQLRKQFLLLPLATVAVALAASAQEPTLAKLTHDGSADLPHSSIRNTWNAPPPSHHGQSSALPVSVLARSAANALFVRSDLDLSRTLAQQVLRHDPRDVEALFVLMEASEMEDDVGTALDAAIRLCDAGQHSPADARVRLAAVRVRETAGNTPEFRSAIPRIQSVLANSQHSLPELQEGLLQAAMDGAPGLNPYTLSRAAGILTDWRIVGPMNRLPLSVDESVSTADDLSRVSYQNHAVENFQFPDGHIVLPDYLSHHGTFYAASRFASLTAGLWQIKADASRAVEIYVDGSRVARTGGTRPTLSATFEAPPGPHKVLVKFMASSTPLRVTITPAGEELRSAPPSKVSLQELTYLLAAEHYAAGDFEVAANQASAIPPVDRSAPLVFLIAEALTQASPGSRESLTAWEQLQTEAPQAFAADKELAQAALAKHDSSQAAQLANRVVAFRPDDDESLQIAIAAWQPGSTSGLQELWERQIAAHPSCKNVRAALSFYHDHGDAGMAASVARKLDGCSPESLDYAKALSEQGSHAEAARWLQQFTAAAPLNRDARLMLVRELQLAGEDEAAQQAAVDWLRIAPNAATYHRLAASAEPQADDLAAAFYSPYRRDAADLLRQTNDGLSLEAGAVVLDDHVAIARPDGSVSLYVHNVWHPSTDSAQAPSNIVLPQGAQVIRLGILHADSTSIALGHDSRAVQIAPGDAIDEEYVVNYTGDGGIPEHPEAFQFVFGSFGRQVLNARFVVLTPAGRADRGAVIATGGAPAMSAVVQGGMLQRVWAREQGRPPRGWPSTSASGLPIIRVVEEEHGWTVPSNAEHQRRIETIHPGPRPQDS